MISHLHQYIIVEMTRNYRIVCKFIMHGEVYIFGIKVISRLIGLICENIAKMANKIFYVPNHHNTMCRSNWDHYLVKHLFYTVFYDFTSQTMLV